MNALIKYLDILKTDLGPSVKKAVADVIDEESNKCYQSIKDGTPISDKAHKHLVESLKMEKITSSNKYGWKIDYDGYNENGVPFSLIARSLNKGSNFGGATHHIDKAVHQLKGMDDRISKKVDEKLKEIVNKG